jgi:hypothetical protein
MSKTDSALRYVWYGISQLKLPWPAALFYFLQCGYEPLYVSSSAVAFNGLLDWDFFYIPHLLVSDIIMQIMTIYCFLVVFPKLSYSIKQ